MIFIDPSQRDLQRIVWKEGINEPIKVYNLSTITYGTTSAPYLATRTLKQLALDEEKDFRIAAEVIKTDTYMDDIVTGCPDIATARELQRQLKLLLQRGGMNLHKWSANHEELLRDISEGAETYSFTEDSETKTLGILWNHKCDEFAFKVALENLDIYTKRAVLSNIARIYDPLGLIGPIIVKAKIFVQKLWLLHIGWDEPLPDQESKEWKSSVQSLSAIHCIKVKRCILIEDAVDVQLNGFADASENGYGAAIYVKSTAATGETATHLLCSESKVAPLKRISIPRLELNAAVLLAKLLHRVMKSLQVSFSEVHLWSDSTIVLAWLKSDPHVLKTFVANRIALLQELTNGFQWHHIRSEDNPSDMVSRGLDPSKLLDNKLWWHGPDLLNQELLRDEVIDDPLQQPVFCDEFKTQTKTKNVTVSLLVNSRVFIV
ncbi:uncharacterized protein LOC129231704 [Uloborus diversus]|uniref:uncharacterized protein LOC129231704 n=1 Tax=Uloborus diversus TaxID=327109 RepID=UPI00240A4EE4|nr:uncharacterized protein LOC129231704 [Uloborus diversus]